MSNTGAGGLCVSMTENSSPGSILLRQRSVIVRQTDSGEQLSAVRIVNDPMALGLHLEKARTLRWWLEAMYGWYWAVDVLQACGAHVLLAHPLGVKGFRYFDSVLASYEAIPF